MKHATALTLYLFAFIAGLGWEEIHPSRAMRALDAQTVTATSNLATQAASTSEQV